MSNTYSDSDRLRWAFEQPKSPSRTEFERDRARVLHSSALRRLGAKTQVLGPEQDDFIRTRLTHSLEVAQIGRSLAKNLGCDPDIVETACLCHDIGHPPFGHNGERALNEVASGFGGFEGNAQTLRVLTRLEAKRFHPDGRPAGLNLTRASLDATIKYPWPRYEGPAGESSPKFGAYESDREVFEWAHEDHGHRRCIEAQIMDLSDDIAYCVHDVEDSVVHTVAYSSPNGSLATTDFNDDANRSAVIESTRAWYGDGVSADELDAAFQRLLTEKSWPRDFDGSMRSLAQLKDLTSDLIGRFIASVTRATVEIDQDADHARYGADIYIPRETLTEITLLKGLAVHFVMEPREHEPDFFEQRSIIFDLMDALEENPEERLEPMFVQMWRDAEGAGKKRVFVDQIASLTDQSARMLHSRYCGMLRH